MNKIHFDNPKLIYFACGVPWYKGEGTRNKKKVSCGNCSAVLKRRDAEPEDPDRWVSTSVVSEMLELPRTWVIAHQKELGGVKIGRYLRFRLKSVQKRMENRLYSKTGT